VVNVSLIVPAVLIANDRVVLPRTASSLANVTDDGDAVVDEGEVVVLLLSLPQPVAPSASIASNTARVFRMFTYARS
jgi:hypothetical protein